MMLVVLSVTRGFKPCLCAFWHLASGLAHRAARRRGLAALTEKSPEEIRASRTTVVKNRAFPTRFS
jgi:hypothetical protein